MNYEARDKYGVYKDDASGNLKPGPHPKKANAPNVVRVYNRNDDESGLMTDNRAGYVQRKAGQTETLSTKIHDPLTHDYVIFAGITIIMALMVVVAHLTYGNLAVAEWQLSKAIETLPGLNPWVIIGGAAVLGLMVILTPRLRSSMRHLVPS
ncbi:MAG: hypothetical protein IPK65_07180 [Gammaproteobacteria bacterium]|nr:hypothetical protein [Gammaproteobacteria bacterium]